MLTNVDAPLLTPSATVPVHSKRVLLNMITVFVNTSESQFDAGCSPAFANYSLHSRALNARASVQLPKFQPRPLS